MNGEGLEGQCRCGHMVWWHSKDGRVCEYHCGNPERCSCAGYFPRRAAVDRGGNKPTGSSET